MSKQTYGRSFKVAVVRRIVAGERVSALSAELGVKARNIHRWVQRFREDGEAALRRDGRPTRLEAAVMQLAGELDVAPRAGPPDELELARVRIAALERKVGRQELELDFFQRALRHVEEARPSSGGPGGTGSTRSSRR